MKVERGSGEEDEHNDMIFMNLLIGFAKCATWEQTHLA
jgi:hypothetical protein